MAISSFLLCIHSLPLEVLTNKIGLCRVSFELFDVICCMFLFLITQQISPSLSSTFYIPGMTLNCIHIFIVTGSFLFWCVMRPASQRFFLIHSCIYLRILIISYLATFLGTNGLYVLMCCKAVNQSINRHIINFTQRRNKYKMKSSYRSIDYSAAYKWH